MSDHRRLSLAAGATIGVLAGEVLVLVAVALVRQRPTWQWRHLLLPVGLVAAVVATTTGLSLPWDQLALEEVTAGRPIAGYEWIWAAEPVVQFVIVDGVETSTTAMAVLFASHLALTGVLVVALGLLAVQPRRSAGGGPNRPST